MVLFWIIIFQSNMCLKIEKDEKDNSIVPSWRIN